MDLVSVQVRFEVGLKTLKRRQPEIMERFCLGALGGLVQFMMTWLRKDGCLSEGVEACTYLGIREAHQHWGLGS